MRKVLFLMLISTPLFAAQKYGFKDPHLDDEMVNNYREHSFPVWVNARGSSATITFLSVSTESVKQLNASSGTINSFMVVGTATDDDAPSGRIGEYKSSSTLTFNFTGTSNQYKDVVSVSLTPGDWDITAQAQTNNNVSATQSWTLAVSTTSGNSSAGLITGDTKFDQTITTSMGAAMTQTIANWRLVLTTSETAYLKHSYAFTSGTPQLSGARISARRVR